MAVRGANGSLVLTIEDYVGKEVFLVSDAEEFDISEISVFTNLGALKECLFSKSTFDDTMCVYHGVLGSAKVIPPSFRGKSVFLISRTSDMLADGDELVLTGNILDVAADNSDELAYEIEQMLEENGTLYLAGIEDTFILYGYQLQVHLTIDEDFIDEETIDTCKEVVGSSKNFKLKGASNG